MILPSLCVLTFIIMYRLISIPHFLAYVDGVY